MLRSTAHGEVISAFSRAAVPTPVQTFEVGALPRAEKLRGASGEDTPGQAANLPPKVLAEVHEALDPWWGGA